MAVQLKKYNPESATSKVYIEHFSTKFLLRWDAEIYSRNGVEMVRFKGLKLNSINIEVPLEDVTFEGDPVTKEELLAIVEQNK
jgi:hypothetical protein